MFYRVYQRFGIHIGVGFCVARSTELGNAKASQRGTGDGMDSHAFSYIGDSIFTYSARGSRLNDINLPLVMAVRHRKETVAKSSGNSCRRCGRSYWELLPACPYCGSTNRGASSADTFETSAKPMDPRKAMKLISDNFYYIFLAFSMICAVLVVIHDIPENISNHFSDAFQSLQTKTRVLFLGHISHSAGNVLPLADD